MRVLDVYPNYCWSFEANSPVAIRQMRGAAAIADEAVRSAELDQIQGARAFRLVGDAVSFDLVDDYFDEVRVEYSPTVLKSLILRQKCKRWLKPEGRLHLPEAGQEPSREPAYVPLRGPVLVPA